MYHKALQIATAAHDGQVDKAGQPYIYHPLAVANQLASQDAKIVALLHDIVEDTSVTVVSLKELGFTSQIVDAVDAITKRVGEAYDDYLQRVKANTLAREVKLADLAHNMDVSRLPSISEEDQIRLKKYQYASNFLSFD